MVGDPAGRLYSITSTWPSARDKCEYCTPFIILFVWHAKPYLHNHFPPFLLYRNYFPPFLLYYFPASLLYCFPPFLVYHFPLSSFTTFLLSSFLPLFPYYFPPFLFYCIPPFLYFRTILASLTSKSRTCHKVHTPSVPQCLSPPSE